MKFIGIGKGRNGGQEGDGFKPTDAEGVIIAPFLADRDVSFMDAKALILSNSEIPAGRRLLLAEYLRDQRAANPTKAEGVFSKPGLGER